MDGPAPIKELQNEIASMIPGILGNCAGLKIRFLRVGAGQVPYHLFWAKVDPQGLMSQDKRLWEAAQRNMKVPVIKIDFSKVNQSQLALGRDNWDLVEGEMWKIINKYTQMFHHRGEDYEPWRGLDPRLILFRFKPFDLTIGPTNARASIPPRCSERYKRFMGIDDVQVRTHKTTLHLDDPYDPNRRPWEREWIDWNGEMAEREARNSGRSKRRHGRSGDRCIIS